MMPGPMRIFAVAFLAVLLAASAGPSARFWGAGAWGAVSFTVAAVASLACLSALSARAGMRLARAMEPSPRARRWVVAAVALAATGALWLLRSGHFLLGRRYTEGLLAAAGDVSPVAPLSSLILRTVFAGLNGLFFWNAFDSAALLAVLAGPAWAAAAAGSLRLVLEEDRTGDADDGSAPGRLGWGLAAVLAGGYSAVFFGAGASAALGTAATGLFILVSLLHVRGRVPLLIPALALPLAAAAWGGAVFLAGGFLVLLIDCAADPARRRETVPAVLTLVPAAVAVELATGMAGRLAASLRAALGAARSAGAAAALDPVNVALAAGPAAILGIVLLAAVAMRRKGRPDATHRFLGATAASALALIILAAPKARGGLLVDLFAPAGAALSLYAVAALGRIVPRRGRFVASAVLLTLLGCLHLAPLVAVDASLGWGRSRVLSLPLPPGRAEHLIGAQALHDRDFEEAARWLEEASGKAPGDAEILYELGRASMRIDEPLDAITHFARALRIEPRELRYRTGLSEAYIARQWYPEAAAELDTLTRAYPDSARLWTRLGFARNHGRMYEGAVEAYGRALALDPDNDEYARNITSALLNRGVELQEAGDFDGARAMYRRARAAYPLDWISLNNLAALEMEQGNWEEAYRILSQALLEHPHIPQLHYNMTRVKEHFGEYGEALYHIRRGALLDRFGTPPVDEIERLKRIVEELGIEVPADTALSGAGSGP